MAESITFGVASAWEFAFGVNGVSAPLVLASSNSGTGSQTYQLQSPTSRTTDGRVINPLVVNGSLTVGTGSTAETVVITAVSIQPVGSSQLSTFTASFANAHSSGEVVSSGSFGLQEAANDRLIAGGGCVALSPKWWANYSSHSAGVTALTGFKSLGATVQVLDYSGTANAVSYTAAAGSIYASTTNKLY